eukprot:2282469-Rhodomonas_salina.2
MKKEDVNGGRASDEDADAEVVGVCDEDAPAGAHAHAHRLAELLQLLSPHRGLRLPPQVPHPHAALHHRPQKVSVPAPETAVLLLSEDDYQHAKRLCPRLHGPPSPAGPELHERVHFAVEQQDAVVVNVRHPQPPILCEAHSHRHALPPPANVRPCLGLQTRAGAQLTDQLFDRP